jgi:hypothetical protein
MKMGTENKKTMSPLTAEQQEKVIRRRRQNWSIEKIARDLHVSEKRVSAYLKSMAVQKETTSAKKPKEGKKVADKKSAKADKKPCKCGKCKKPTKGEKTCQKELIEEDYLDQTIKEVFKTLTSNFQDCVDLFFKDLAVIQKCIEKGIPARDMVEDAKQKCLKESQEIVRNFYPRIIVVKRVD